MTKFLTLIFGFLLAGLFIISIISGGIMLAQNNNAEQSISDDESIRDYAKNLNETLEDAYGNAMSAEGAINQSSVTLTTGFPVFDAIFGVWKTLKTVPTTIYNLTVGLLVDRVFGGGYMMVFGVIGAIFIIAIIYAVYKSITTGDAG